MSLKCYVLATHEHSGCQFRAVQCQELIKLYGRRLTCSCFFTPQKHNEHIFFTWSSNDIDECLVMQRSYTVQYPSLLAAMESTNSWVIGKGPGVDTGMLVPLPCQPYPCQFLHLLSHTLSLSSNQTNCLYFQPAIRWIECRSLASLGTVLVTVLVIEMDVSSQFGTPEPHTARLLP
jgi:hypothetical protein